MKKIILSLLAALACSPAHAEDYISLSAGGYDALRHKDPATLFGAEYRFSPLEYNIRPIIGGFVTTDSGAYGYAGFDWDVSLIQNQLFLIPNFAVGAYSDGNGRQLGGPLEFRSGLELDYQLPNAQRIGVALNHISNASIYKHNPGEENVIATYSIPVATIGHWVGAR
ncbi:MAG: acyloxyacyl hydrolase [Pseudomonadota bacterium]|nr:acyloxyacyl hydrolase [Pseudomonadota bacterium]